YIKHKDNELQAEDETSKYLTIQVKIPDEEYTQIRHYTISAAPGSDTYRISVKKETDFTPNGKVSTYLHDFVNVGDTIEASAPAGTFTSDDDKRTVTLISGGVGITPMISMIYTLAYKKTDLHNNLLHDAHNTSFYAFQDHL